MNAVDGHGDLVVAVGAGGVILEEQRAVRRVLRVEAGAFADVWVGDGGEAYAVGEDVAVRSMSGLWSVLPCDHTPLALVDGVGDNVVAAGEAGMVRLTRDGCELLAGNLGGPVDALAVTSHSVWLGMGSSVCEFRGGATSHEGTLAPGHASYALVADGDGVLLIGAELSTAVEAVRGHPRSPTVPVARALARASRRVALHESATALAAALPHDLTDAWTADGSRWWLVQRGRLLVEPSRGDTRSVDLAYRARTWTMIQGFSGGFAASGDRSDSLALVMRDGTVGVPFVDGELFGVSALTTDGESLIATGHSYVSGTPSLGSERLAGLPTQIADRAADVPEVAGGRACFGGEARAVSAATCCATSSTHWAVEPTGEVTRRSNGSTSRISVGAPIWTDLVRSHAAVCNDDTLRFVTSATSVTSCAVATCDVRELAAVPTGVAPFRTEVTGACTLVVDAAGAAWVYRADAWIPVVARAPVLDLSASGRDLLLLHAGGVVTIVPDGCG